jgi:hypothetical protein
VAADHRRRLLLGAAAWALAPGVRAATAPRSALILGNARYPGAALKNAGNDAQLIHSVAGELGFLSTLLLDADLARMIEAVQRWLAASSASTTRLLYYAGHGAQYRGRNYLIPIDAELRSEDDLPGRALEVDGITDRLSRLATGVNLLVLDACRSAPLLRPPPGSRQRAGAGRAPAPGLAALQAPRGTLVAYATAPGALAADDPAADHSPYTRHLARRCACRVSPSRRSSSAHVPPCCTKHAGPRCPGRPAAWWVSCALRAQPRRPAAPLAQAVEVMQRPAPALRNLAFMHGLRAVLLVLGLMCLLQVPAWAQTSHTGPPSSEEPGCCRPSTRHSSSMASSRPSTSMRWKHCRISTTFTSTCSAGFRPSKSCWTCASVPTAPITSSLHAPG